MAAEIDDPGPSREGPLLPERWLSHINRNFHEVVENYAYSQRLNHRVLAIVGGTYDHRQAPDTISPTTILPDIVRERALQVQHLQSH